MINLPFYGVYRNKAGKYLQLLDGSEVLTADLSTYWQPFYGVFYDKDGVEHELSDLSGGAISVLTQHVFTDATSRDAHFAEHREELVDGLYVVVNGILQQYKNGQWVDMSPVIQGPQGIPGRDGSTSVNSVQPVDGNVNLTANDILTTSGKSIQETLDEGGGGVETDPVWKQAEPQINSRLSSLEASSSSQSIVQPSFRMTVTANSGSNVFELPKTPDVIFDVWILEFDESGETQVGMFYLLPSNYSISSKSVTINNPTLTDRMQIKINYTSKEV